MKLTNYFWDENRINLFLSVMDRRNFVLMDPVLRFDNKLWFFNPLIQI